MRSSSYGRARAHASASAWEQSRSATSPASPSWNTSPGAGNREHRKKALSRLQGLILELASGRIDADLIGSAGFVAAPFLAEGLARPGHASLA
jgi:hypothetical protein